MLKTRSLARLFLRLHNKVNAMIDEDISKGKYVKTVDSTHKDLKHFKDFLVDIFTKQNIMVCPISN